MGVKKILSTGLFSLGIMMIGVCGANAQELSGDITERTTLTEDTKLTGNVKLDKVLQVESGKSITLDLNGYKLEAPNFSSDEYYAIENNGNLTIVDNGSEKGEISCTKTGSSCIRNTGTITMTGVNVSSTWLTFKNEGGGVATINSSNISSSDTSLNGATIFNYGTLTINNSDIAMTGNKKNAAVYATNSDDNGVHKTSKTVINNSTLSSKGAKTISIPYGAGSNNSDDELILNSITMIGGFDVGTNTKTSISGDIKTTYLGTTKLLTNATKGTVVTLINGDVVAHKLSNNGTIPEGVTLKISDGIDLKINNPYTLNVEGKLQFVGSSKYTLAGSNSKVVTAVYNKTQNSYYGTIDAVLADANVNDEIEIIDTNMDLSNISNGSMTLVKNDNGGYTAMKVKKDTLPENNTPTNDNVSEVKNPETSDNIVIYIVLSMVALTGTVYLAKRLRKNYN